MHEIRSEVKFATTLSADNSDIQNWDEYIDYLNDVIYKLTKDQDKKLNYHSDKFGDLSIIIYLDSPLDDDDGKFEIRLRIQDSRDNFNEDDWYDGLADDTAFMNYLEEQLIAYINELNPTLGQIQHPLGEELIYKNESLYMRISPINDKHTPEFVHFSVEPEVDRDQIFDNIWVN